MLVSSASTTNTREIKNSFLLERYTAAHGFKNAAATRSKNCQNETKNSICGFFCFVYVYDIVMIFVSIFCLLSFDKYTKNY